MKDSDAGWVIAAARAWARRVGSDAIDTVENPSANAVLHRFGRPGEARVSWWELVGGGHAWPGGERGGLLRERMLGPTPKDLKPPPRS